MKNMILTKPKALKLLEQMHDSQRDLNWKKVYEYKEKINNGSFGFRQESAIEFLDKKVSNGQHRIMAFLLSKADTLKFSVQRRLSSPVCNFDN